VPFGSLRKTPGCFSGISIPPGSPLLVQGNKTFHTAIAGGFHIRWKITGRQFAQPTVVLNALTANSFSAAGESAGTKISVRVFFTIHKIQAII